MDLPATHDITFPSKDLSKTANHDVRVWEHVHIDKVANGLIDDNSKIIAISKGPNSLKIWCFQKRIARKLAKKGKELFTTLTPALQIIQVGGTSMAVEHATRAPFLQNLEGINIRKSVQRQSSPESHVPKRTHP